MSMKGKMIHLMMRYRHLRKGTIRRDRITPNTSITRLRKECDASAERYGRLPSGIVITEVYDAPVYAEWIKPKSADDSKVILYFHGGGFVMGNVKSHRGIVGNFVMHTGYQALLFDYRLAPEFPSPAAVYDSAAIYCWLLERGFFPDDIIFAGDSAGGGIEIGTLLKLKDDGIPLPAACIAFSPSLDMTISGDSHRTRRRSDPCTPQGMTEIFYRYYVGDGDPQHPYTSPLFGDLSGLPPIMIHVGNDEVLRDDATRFGLSAEVCGTNVRVRVWKGMFHCFPLLSPLFPEATEAMKEVSSFVHHHMKKESGIASTFFFMILLQCF